MQCINLLLPYLEFALSVVALFAVLGLGVTWLANRLIARRWQGVA